MTDKEKYGLTTWQALLLLLLEIFTKRQWMPETIDVPVPPPTPHLPEFVEPFKGILDKYACWYAPKDFKAVWETTDQVAVFFSDPKQSYEITLPNGGTAIKHVFTARTSPEQPIPLNISAGKRILTYSEKIPTTANKISRAYADGEAMIEICDPVGGALRVKNVKMLGFQNPDGSWVVL